MYSFRLRCIALAPVPMSSDSELVSPKAGTLLARHNALPFLEVDLELIVEIEPLSMAAIVPFESACRIHSPRPRHLALDPPQYTFRQQASSLAPRRRFLARPARRAQALRTNAGARTRSGGEWQNRTQENGDICMGFATMRGVA